MKINKDIFHESIVLDWGDDADIDSTIGNGYDLNLSRPFRVLLEWVMRTPHAYPFNLKKHNCKFNNEYPAYVLAMFDLIFEASQIIDGGKGVVVECYAKASPLVNTLIDGAKEWLICNEEDKWVKQFIFKIEYNDYRIQASEDRFKIKCAINNLSIFLNKKLKGMGGTQVIHGFVKTALKNYKHGMQVVDQAFQRNSSILLMRLDWGEEARVPDNRANFESIKHYEERFDKVSSFREKMLKELKKMFKEDLCFFMWKIECAPIRGLHIHWFIGVNGSKYNDRINVSKVIAKKWDEIINEPGSYTRIQSTRQYHEDAILRVIDYHDPLLWRIVGGYVNYLTKVDYLIRFRAPGNQRCFGTSKLKEIKGSKKGPKRSKQMPKLDMLAVRRPLKELSDEMGWKEYKG